MNTNEFYFDNYEFYKYHLNKGGKILGCYVNDRLIAYGALIFPGFDNENLGYDLKLEKEELLKVAHLDSVAVHPDYRGNKLQYQLICLLEKIAIEKGYRHLYSTVSPTNKYSINNLLKLGLEIKIEKEKYDGKIRLILYKSLIWALWVLIDFYGNKDYTNRVYETISEDINGVISLF